MSLPDTREQDPEDADPIEGRFDRLNTPCSVCDICRSVGVVDLGSMLAYTGHGWTWDTEQEPPAQVHLIKSLMSL